MWEFEWAFVFLNQEQHFKIKNNNFVVIAKKFLIFSISAANLLCQIYDGILSCYQRNVQWCLGYWTYATSTPFWLNRYWDFIDRIYFIEIELIEENKWKTFKRTFEKEIFHRSWHSHPSSIWLDVQFLMYNEGWNIMS